MCLADHAARIRQGLTVAGVTVPVLAIGADNAELFDAEGSPSALAAAFPGGVSPLPYGIPRIIPCDEESPLDVVIPQVKAVLIQHLSRSTDHVSTTILAHETLVHLPVYGQAARNAFQRKVDDSAHAIATSVPNTFQFSPRTGTRDALVRFTRTPEHHDPRGRTQGYQALARTGHTGRRARKPDPDQLDLLAELGTEADEVDVADDDEGTESP